MEGILLILSYSYFSFTLNSAFPLSSLTLSIVMSSLYRWFINMPSQVNGTRHLNEGDSSLLWQLLFPPMSMVIFLFALDGTRAAQHVTTALILLCGVTSFAYLVSRHHFLARCGTLPAPHTFAASPLRHTSQR